MVSMDASLPILPSELRDAIDAQGGSPLYLHDDRTNKVYVLMEEVSSESLNDDEIRRLIAEADEDIARGDVAPLDMDQIKREGRRLLAERQLRRKS